MKNLFGLLLVCAMFALTSCGGDSCDTDLAGTYTGTSACTLLGDSDATVTITGTDGNYSVSATGITIETFDEQDGCELKFSNTVLGIGTTGKITLSGSTLTMVITDPLETCTFTGTK